VDKLLALISGGLRPLTPSGIPSPEAIAEDALAGQKSIFVIDLEMSGPNPREHEVLEIGGVRAKLAPGLEEEASWGTRVRPRHIGNAELGALKVMGYNVRGWKDAIELDEAFARMADLAPGAVIAGWGMGGDLAFLSETARRLGRDWPFASLALDIQVIARKVLKESGRVDRMNLGHVADRLGIGRMGEHSALADAYATYDIIVKLAESA
jgi:DNA polymerase III epsilon subunit-like protein